MTKLYSYIRLSAIFVTTAMLLALGGCRSVKPTSVAEQENRWSDLYVPVKLELTEPSRMSISGRATMVRDKSVYLSLRMIGMEVATVYIDADSIFATEKMNRQMVGVDYDRVMGRLTIGELQDLLLGDSDGAVGKLPKELSYAVDRSENGNTVTVNLKVAPGKKTYAGRLIWDMGAAQFDTGDPRQWRRPSGYTVIDAAKLPRLLETF